MSERIHHTRGQVSYLLAICGLLLAVVLLAAACGGPSAPISPEPTVMLAESTPGSIETSQAYDNLRPQNAPSNTKFERISVEQGLSNATVSVILQDSQGFMWFGTADGLNKYDGYSFMVYRHDPEDPHSLRDNVIESIYEDRSGVLWIGTQGGWLERHDRKHDQFTHYQVSSHVLAIYEDTAGVFWIGSQDPGLLRFDRDTGEAELVWQGREFRTIVEDREGVVWVGNRDGWIGRYDRENDRFVRESIVSPVMAMIEDQKGELWIGTSREGLLRYDQDTGQYRTYQNDPHDPNSLGGNNIRMVYEDRSGALWVATWDGGLNRLDPDTGQVSHYQNDPCDPQSLSDDHLTFVYQDRSGVLWIGTAAAGLSKLALERKRFSHYHNISNDPNSLGQNIVNAIYQDRSGTLWIGTNDGLDRLDRERREWRHYRHDPDSPHSLSAGVVWSIYQDRAGALWVGTDSRLDMYDQENDQFIHYLIYRSHSMLEDSSGNFLIATGSGLVRFAPDAYMNYVLVRKGHSGKISGLEDRQGMFWLGSSGDGVERYNPETGEWRPFRHDPHDPSSLSSDFVESILEDRSGVLWFGTGGGLDRFDRETETFTHYRVKDGLANDSIYGVLEDSQGYLWLSTMGGVSRFDPRTETFKNYDVSDGLQSNQFRRGAYHQSKSGEMFFGGVNGFNAFYPELITDNSHVPPVVITAFSLFNEVARTALPPDEHIELTYKENSLAFDFAALDYNAPQKNQYAYKMEGLDEDWVYAGTRRHADYPNLRPGDYVFRVKGSNNDGVWNEQGASVHITIKPPFWETWWFRGVVALALVGVAVGGYRLRVRGVEARSRELERQVEEEINRRMRVEEALRQSEMEKAVAAERSRLARELHDAVTQTLFSASLIAEALPVLWERDQERGRERLAKLRQMSRGALAEMRGLLLELRPAALVETSLEDLLRQLGEAVTGREGVPVTVEVEGASELPTDVHVALYRIAQEALNNVVKHARSSQVEVRLRCLPPTPAGIPPASGGACPEPVKGDRGGAIELCIRDDGRGFDPDDVSPVHLGLNIMRERAQAIGAALTIKSKPGHGTQITVEWMSDKGRQ